MDILDLELYSTSRTLVFFIIITLFIGLEYFLSLHRIGKAGVRKRRQLNWYLGLFNMLLMFPISTLGAAIYCQYYQIGLFYSLHLSWWVVLICWLAIYDFSVYLFHRLMHSGYFWTFHKVHHSETSPNSTTSYRFHPIEYFMYTLWKIGLIFMLGPFYFVLLFTDIIQAVLVFFGHSNIKLNTRFEQLLSKLIITPRYHLIHHAEQCNHNYATGFTLWDKLGKTFKKPMWTIDEINAQKYGSPQVGRQDNLLDLLLITQFKQFIKTYNFLHLKMTLIVITGLTAFWLIALQFPAITHGLIGTNILYCILFFLLTLHVTMITISIYLHRSETHRAVNFHPAVRHFFRFWLWLFTGINRRDWVAIHRLHHQSPDTEKDPHSPVVHGLRKLFTHGLELYHKAKITETTEKLGCITDNDVLERRLYGTYSIAGPLSLFCIELILLGVWAIPLWLIQMILHIMLQASVINGLGHAVGYRNFNVKDNSHNITRLGIVIAGEELHNNHHQSPASAKFSCRADEFDIGWGYICLLRKLGLAKIKLKPVASIDLKYTKRKFKDFENRSHHYGHVFIVMVCAILFL